MNATTTAPRYFATRTAGRYRVFDTQGATEVEVAVCSSKAKAQEKADKLNAADLDARLAAAADAAEAQAEDTLVEAVNRGDEAGADNARAALDTLVGRPTAKRSLEELSAAVAEESPADARSERATALAEQVAAGELSFDDAAAELLTGRPVAKPVEVMAAAVAAKVAAKPATAAYRIGKVLREFILTQVTPADSELVAHIVGRNVCYDGTATLRVTPEWVAELSAFATALENDALSGEKSTLAASLRAPAVNAARGARKTLGALFA